MGDEVAADENHDDERQPHNGEGCQDGPQACCPRRVSCVQTRGVAHIGGAGDANRTWGGLADGHDVCKLGIGEPMVLHYRLVMNERKHRVASAEIECTNLGKYEE